MLTERGIANYSLLNNLAIKLDKIRYFRSYSVITRYNAVCGKNSIQFYAILKSMDRLKTDHWESNLGSVNLISQSDSV